MTPTKVAPLGECKVEYPVLGGTDINRTFGITKVHRYMEAVEVIRTEIVKVTNLIMHPRIFIE